MILLVLVKNDSSRQPLTGGLSCPPLAKDIFPSIVYAHYLPSFPVPYSRILKEQISVRPSQDNERKGEREYLRSCTFGGSYVFSREAFVNMSLEDIGVPH